MVRGEAWWSKMRFSGRSCALPRGYVAESARFRSYRARDARFFRGPRRHLPRPPGPSNADQRLTDEETVIACLNPLAPTKYRYSPLAHDAGRRLQAPMRRIGLGLALDVNLAISRSATECAVGFARLRNVCPLRTRCLLRGPGPRIEGSLGAGLERVRLMLVGCRCLGFVHGGDPFDLHRSGRLSSPSMTR